MDQELRKEASFRFNTVEQTEEVVSKCGTCGIMRRGLPVSDFPDHGFGGGLRNTAATCSIMLPMGMGR
jgi:hypothetical protein